MGGIEPPPAVSNDYVASKCLTIWESTAGDLYTPLLSSNPPSPKMQVRAGADTTPSDTRAGAFCAFRPSWPHAYGTSSRQSSCLRCTEERYPSSSFLRKHPDECSGYYYLWSPSPSIVLLAARAASLSRFAWHTSFRSHPIISAMPAQNHMMSPSSSIISRSFSRVCA